MFDTPLMPFRERVEVVETPLPPPAVAVMVPSFTVTFVCADIASVVDVTVVVPPVKAM